VLVLIATLVGAAAALGARRYPAPREPVLETAREVGRRAPGLRRALSTRLDPERATGLALTLALVLIFGGGLVLAALAIVVRTSHALAGVDGSVANWGNRQATAFSTDGLKVVTDLGETWMAIAVVVAVALVEMRTIRSRWVVPFMVLVVVGDKLLTGGIKHLVDRVRPDLNPVAATLGPSFPSGHSSTAAALWAATALVAGRWLGRRAYPALAALAVGIAVAVAASRVLLDVHWLTDVIAGLALGWAWFAACAVAFGGRILRFGAAAEAAKRGADTEIDRPASSDGTSMEPQGGGVQSDRSGRVQVAPERPPQKKRPRQASNLRPLA
jgi:membrane-associated phospholipid phosphatase